MYEARFEKIVECVFGIEKGYSNNKNDLGGPTNFGITHTTYDSWNKRHNKPLKDVKEITKEEAKEILYYDYWFPSGASEVKDIRLAYCLFDMAVNSGEYYARREFKKSNGDFDKFIENRKKYYEQIVEDKPEQKEHFDGWMNRLEDLQIKANKLAKEEEVEELQSRLNQNFPGKYTPETISKMSLREYKTKEKEIKAEINERRKLIEKFNHDVKKLEEKYNNKAVPTGFATNISNSNTDNTGFENVSSNGKKWKYWTHLEKESFIQGFDMGVFTKEGEKQYKMRQKIEQQQKQNKKLKLGNLDKGDGHWITTFSTVAPKNTKTRSFGIFYTASPWLTLGQHLFVKN